MSSKLSSLLSRNCQSLSKLESLLDIKPQIPHSTSLGFSPLAFTRLSAAEQPRRALEFYDLMRQRRTVRAFSPEPPAL